MEKLAAVYGRVSTAQQEQEATMESQVAAIESYAQQHGYGLNRSFYFLDQAVSGAKLERPALDKLRDMASEGLFTVVLCLSPDRLARHYAHQWILLNELQQAGVKVHFVNQPMIEENPQGQLLLGMQGVFAEYERDLIRERLRRGKLYRMRQGQLVNPVAAYGYRYIPVSEANGGRWEVHAAEASVVQQIYQWYTSEDLTIHQIVQRLQSLGEQAPARGKQWQFSTVQAILKQRAYTGTTYYNQTRSNHEVVGQPKRYGRGPKRDPIHLPRPVEEWIPLRVPVIVPEPVWQQAQERLIMNQKFAARNNQKHFYLLRSLLVCSHCGHTLIGRPSGQRITYYCPFASGRRDPAIPAHHCLIDGTTIETLVWQAVSNLLDNPLLMADAWQQHSSTPAAQPNELERLQARQRTLERHWQRLLDLFQEEQIDKTEFSKRKLRLDSERQTLEQRLALLNRLVHQQEVRTKMLDDFSAFCQEIQRSMTDSTPQLQQDVIRLLVDHVVISDDDIIIKHIIPTDNDCRLLPGRR